MHKIQYKGTIYNCHDGELVLDTLLRQGVNAPFSCRSGSCHVCMSRCSEGTIPADAQLGVEQKLKQLDYFLPCKCIPEGDMDIEPANKADLFIDAIVNEKTRLTDDTCRLLLEPCSTFEFEPGQFINIRKKNGELARSYSLAGLQDDYFLELHIKRRQGGALTGWVFDELQVGDEIEIQGPIGEFTYEAAGLDKDEPMLLLAAGTGLAPVIGIARHALQAGHTGPIHLYHGSRDIEGLYRDGQLQALAEANENFHYVPCVSREPVSSPFQPGRASDIAFSEHPDLSGWTVFIAGLPDMVAASEAGARSAGAQIVFTDAFELKDLRAEDQGTPEIHPRRRKGDRDRFSETPYPDPDPELWQALDNGKLLGNILLEFYRRVFEDPRLSPFFRNVTRERIAEKQYAFLKQILTGEKVFFGDRPRNAHHWMVISDELFDYREALMMDVIREHDIPEHLVDRWQAIESHFRKDIVKDEPHGKIIDGVEMPFEGFEELVLDAGTLCDSCHGEISPGTRIRYHIRLGTTYCPQCMNDQAILDATTAMPQEL